MVVLPQPGIRKKEEPLIVEVNMVLSPSMRLIAYPLTVDGTDTLVPLYQTEEKRFFESGKRRVFEFIRVVELYGASIRGNEGLMILNR